MDKQSALKLLKSQRDNAKAESVRYCKDYSNSAKAELVAMTPEMESYYDHLMEWSV